MERLFMIMIGVFAALLTIMCVYYYFNTRDIVLIGYATVFTAASWMFFRMFFNEYKAKEDNL